MSRSRNRPHRGNADRLVPGDVRSIIFGDTGDYAPSDEERISGDDKLHPVADLPGGKTHIVNPQTRAVRPSESTVRPVDEHKQHDVPPIDWATEYDAPAYDITGADERARLRGAPEEYQHLPQAVPVYTVEGPFDTGPVLKVAEPQIVTVAVAGSTPTKLCNQDRRRVDVALLNNDTANDVQIGREQDTVLDGRGAIIAHGSTSYVHLEHQDELWALSVAATAVKLSVILTTEINE